MHILLSPILAWFSSLAGRFLVDGFLKFVAYKALIYTLLITTVPIIIKNLLCWLVGVLQDVVLSSVPSGTLDSITIQLTGLAGYIGDQMLLSTCISILLSALLIRFILNFIPFVG